jgi:ATP synthase F1 gamma subunit
MSLKALEIKIRSTRNLQKITASMKMVASSKMRGVEMRLMAARPFFASVHNIYPQTQTEFDEGNNVFPINTEGDHDDYHIQTITSDAGLCGGVNTIACKHTRLGLADLDEAGKTYSLSVVGDRGRSQIGRLYPEFMTNTYDECYKTPFSFAGAAAIAGSILDADASQVRYLFCGVGGG